jgi:hypothetical protein
LTQEETKAFQKLKEVMCTNFFLATPDFKKTFIVKCDASGHGIGAILMLEGRSISFERKKLKEKNLLKTIYENKCWP